MYAHAYLANSYDICEFFRLINKLLNKATDLSSLITAAYNLVLTETAQLAGSGQGNIRASIEVSVYIVVPDEQDKLNCTPVNTL